MMNLKNLATTFLLASSATAFAPAKLNQKTTAVFSSAPLDFWAAEMPSGFNDEYANKAQLARDVIDDSVHETLMYDGREYHRMTLPKGHEVGFHSHKTSVPVVMKEGKLKITYSTGEEYEFKAGDMYAIPLGTEYKAEALEGPTIYTCMGCATGQWFY